MARQDNRLARYCSCGRRIKQKYFKTCIKCRQQKKRTKRLNRDFRRSLEEISRQNDKLLMDFLASPRRKRKE